MISNSYAIIFDLDGTLVHSIPDMHIAINKTLNEYHLQNISEKKLQTFVGEGMLSLSKKVVDFCGGDNKLYDKIYNSYRKNYADQPYKLSSLMPGVITALDFFYDNNFPMGICTNKRQLVTEKLIKLMNLEKYFSVIIGARDDIPLKPKPDMVCLAIKEFNLVNKSFFMVGDTSNDIDAAKSANIKSIAIKGGYTEVDVEKLGADFTFDGMKDIIDFFKNKSD
ncbi:MAG: HAD-IA family hydrolase [Proteobacteria bacterium]|nr:HAD-IA family hydrolase [Pseudomonadota bacterium]MDA1135427.1 HAD-IA family hydrolase [Pseudomonadota bacterium]